MAEEEQPMDTPQDEPQDVTAETPAETPAAAAAEEADAEQETPGAESAADPSGEPPVEASEEREGEASAEAAAGGIPLKRVAEALVFASPKPITSKEIVAALKAAAEGSENPDVKALGKTKVAAVDAALAELAQELEAAGRAFQLVEKISGWVLVSDPSCAAWVRKLYPEAKPTRLSGPQLETLAIIAYRQPVTRADIEAVRGVAVDGVMQVLLDRSLVKIAGRAEVPGRPLLYSTTEYFLEHFGLKTTDELPNATELKRVPLPTAPPPEAPAADATEKPAGKGKKGKNATPEAGTAAPEEPNAVPEEPNAVPEEPDAVPEEPDAVPEEPDAVPEEPDAVPEEPDAIPEEPNAVPEDQDGDSSRAGGDPHP